MVGFTPNIHCHGNHGEHGKPADRLECQNITNTSKHPDFNSHITGQDLIFSIQIQHSAHIDYVRTRIHVQ